MDCIFCKIVSGEIPSYKVYEDNLFFGFLDIFPLSRGNSLLIPKKHYRWVNDVPEFRLYWEAAKKIGHSLEKNLIAASISYLTLGEEVPHAHSRSMPRYSADDIYLTLRTPITISSEERKVIAKSLS